jgi:pimeloyl-ACP methyl ester carboxylesterase
VPHLHTDNGDHLSYSITGSGKFVLLGYPFGGEGPGDERIGEELAEGLADRYTVIVADHPRGIGSSSAAAPQLMTAAQVTNDLLAIAGDAGAERFTYWGYSWGGAAGLQLACRTQRLDGLIVGGWPPLGGPYADLRLMVDGALADPELPADQRDFVAGFGVFYHSMREWDERSAVAGIACPKLAYVGDQDTVVQGGVTVPLVDLVGTNSAELGRLGWTTHVLPGLDHSGAMRDAQAVLPVVRPFLDGVADAR